MTLKEQIINFCIENIKEIGVVGFITGVVSYVGFKKEAKIIGYVFAIISIPPLIIFFIWLIQLVLPIIIKSFFS